MFINLEVVLNSLHTFELKHDRYTLLFVLFRNNRSVEGNGTFFYFDTHVVYVERQFINIDVKEIIYESRSFIFAVMENPYCLFFIALRMVHYAANPNLEWGNDTDVQRAGKIFQQKLAASAHNQHDSTFYKNISDSLEGVEQVSFVD